jgi:hypothetical protein
MVQLLEVEGAESTVHSSPAGAYPAHSAHAMSRTSTLLFDQPHPRKWLGGVLNVRNLRSGEIEGRSGSGRQARVGDAASIAAKGESRPGAAAQPLARTFIRAAAALRNLPADLL